MGENVVTGHLRFRAREAVARDAAIDEARMFRAECFRVNSSLLKRCARRLVVKENVGVGEKFLKSFRAAWIIIVERDGALVAICGEKIGGFAANERRPPRPRLIAGAGALDLDDIGAKVAKQHRAIRAGEGFGQFDNPDSIERRVHSREYN